MIKPIKMAEVRLAAGEGKLTAHETLAAVNAVLRQRRLGRQEAIMIAKIIEDEIGGEVCTPEWSQAAAERIVCALNNPEPAHD